MCLLWSEDSITTSPRAFSSASCPSLSSLRMSTGKNDHRTRTCLMAYTCSSNSFRTFQTLPKPPFPMRSMHYASRSTQTTTSNS